MGTTNYHSIWTILNTYQLIILIALLDIEYPPNVATFFEGFELAALSMPKEYNLAEWIVPASIRSRGETEKRL